MINKYIVANWKMNMLTEEGMSLAVNILDNAEHSDKTEVVLCPSFILLNEFSLVFEESNMRYGAQDCSPEKKGAYTGDISAEMIEDTGASYVILGHSERRQYHNESSKLVAAKAKAAIEANLTPIICVGETLEQREKEDALSIVCEQALSSIPENIPAPVIVAYEPVWAIGTGKIPSLSDIKEMHDAIINTLINKRRLDKEHIFVLYGGSVKPDNAKDILAIESVGGVLVGGASLNAESFCKIIEAAEKI